LDWILYYNKGTDAFQLYWEDHDGKVHQDINLPTEDQLFAEARKLREAGRSGSSKFPGNGHNVKRGSLFSNIADDRFLTAGLALGAQMPLVNRLALQGYMDGGNEIRRMGRFNMVTIQGVEQLRAKQDAQGRRIAWSVTSIPAAVGVVATAPAWAPYALGYAKVKATGFIYSTWGLRLTQVGTAGTTIVRDDFLHGGGASGSVADTAAAALQIQRQAAARLGDGAELLVSRTNIQPVFNMAGNSGRLFDSSLPFDVKLWGDGSIRISSTHSLVNGRTIPSSRSQPLHSLRGKYDEGNLHIDWYSTANTGNKIGFEMIELALNRLGADRVSSISGILGESNRSAFLGALKSGLTEDDALWSTPLGKAAKTFGFSRIDAFDPTSLLVRFGK
jgi:hypothetical protein